MKKTCGIYWVGPRESDILDCNKGLFAGSITTFGSNKNGNIALCDQTGNKRIDCNNPEKNKISDKFMKEKIEEIISEDKTSKFYFYNGNAYSFISKLDNFREFFEKYRENFICLNDENLMKNLNSKTFFHNDIKSALNCSVELLNTEVGVKTDCKYNDICDKFNIKYDKALKENIRFIFQAPVASGGSGTFILDSENGDEIQGFLEPNENYLFSIYQENNISVNMHAIIFEDEILLSPGSIQLMREDSNRLMYRGADFIAYRSIDCELRKRFEADALKICKLIQKDWNGHKGYRGVCGLDAIIYNGKVQIIEINNRFQASTYLINKALKQKGMKSMQEINMDAFELKSPRDEYKFLPQLEVNYSNYAYVYNGLPTHANHILEYYKNEKTQINHIESLEIDGYNPNTKTPPDALAQLFKVSFSTNISWVNEEGALYIDENICDPLDEIKRGVENYNIIEKYEKEKLEKDKFIYLKSALMTQGVVLDDSVCAEMEKNGGIRPGTNSAIDIKIFDISPHLETGNKDNFAIVNAPRGTKFAYLSPFSIKHIFSDGQQIKALFYYDKQLTTKNLILFPIDPFSRKQTKANNIPYSEIAYLSTDRLRIHLTNRCVFKLKNNSCKFCDIETTYGDIPMEDIEEVISDYIDNCSEMKHFLIGGQSAEDSISKEKLLRIINFIKEKTATKKIYAMVLPYEREQIKKMCEAGLDELGCNIEIFDKDLAKKYMPGKGMFERDFYFDVLQRATARLSDKGSVRSMVIFGLEPVESFKKGIRKLAESGIQPIISVFRPLPNTPLEHFIAPPVKEIVKAYRDAQSICSEFGLKLGPECTYCQNNTLALPYTLLDPNKTNLKV